MQNIKVARIPGNFFKLFVKCEISETVSSNETPEDDRDELDERGLARETCFPAYFEVSGTFDRQAVLQFIRPY